MRLGGTGTAAGLFTPTRARRARWKVTPTTQIARSVNVTAKPSRLEADRNDRE
jgi:hypothetical protein